MTTYIPCSQLTEEQLIARRKYAKKQRDKMSLDQKTARVKNNKRWIHSKTSAYLISGAKKRARKKGIDFNITKEYIESIWNDVCPILGIPLKCNEGVHQDNSFSLDRIDNTKGYIEGNVMIISKRANMIKNCGTAEEHKKIADFLVMLESKSQLLS